MYYIYGKVGCSFCDKAKSLAKSEGLDYQYIDLTEEEGTLDVFREKGWRSVPQIFKDGDFQVGERIGGYTELANYLIDSM